FDAWGRVHGVEAVIDKDRTAALLAGEIGADALLLLTDVDGIYRDWGTERARRIESIRAGELEGLDLAVGSMGPKAVACAEFVRSSGRFAAIGALEDAAELLDGRAGTRVIP
ncbi:MAG TPA: carbamate kinase, partial [Longimicrobiales bacterium]|nr:carbamate kinase [Longimicrobiales bacterium]